MSTPNVPTQAQNDARYATPTSVASAVSGLTGSSSVENTRTSLTRFYGPAADRNNRPVYVVCCGDSWTFGTGSSANGYRWIDTLNTRLQTYWPLASGAAGAAVGYVGNLGSNPNGLRVIGNGHSGAIASSYLPASEITGIAKLGPSMVIHAIGLNDQAQGVNKATFKANLLAAVNAIRQQSTAPLVQVLVRNPDLKRNVSIPWSDYNDAMLEIVATSPSDLVYIDLVQPFEQAQIKNGDPLGLMQTDGGHPNDRGHAFYGETLFAALRPTLHVGSSGVATPVADVVTLYNTVAPTISGTASVGSLLTASNGTWVATPDSYTYQWRRSGTVISGATSSTYTPVSADSGLPVSVAVTAVKASYASRTSVSIDTTVSGSAQALTNSAAPAITGTATQGNTLSVSNGTWSATPDSYQYQWTRAGNAISGATTNTYPLIAADSGQTIACTVTAVKSGYTNGTATATGVAVSGTPTLSNTTVPSLTGATVQGSTLTTTNGTWSVTPDSYTYQWSRGGVAIAGATSSTYILVPGDVGSTITCTVTAIKAGYTSATGTSNASATITSAPASQASETWTGSDGSSWPAQWGVSAGDGAATIQGNQGQLTTLNANNSYKMMYLSGMTASTDQSLYCEFVSPSVGNVKFGLDAASFSYFTPSDGYWVDIALGANAVLWRGGGGFMGQNYFQLAATTAYKIRFQRSGSTVQFRIWLATASEPASWTFSTTDSSPLPGGRVWVVLMNGSSATTTTTATFDNLVVT